MSIPTLTGIPVAIDPSVTAAASAYATSPTEANRLAYAGGLHSQFTRNIPALKAARRSLADQIAVIDGVVGQVQKLAAATNQGENIGSFITDVMAAERAKDEEWSKTRAGAISAAVEEQVAAIVAAMPE